jgi:hypothetical protein
MHIPQRDTNSNPGDKNKMETNIIAASVIPNTY